MALVHESVRDTHGTFWRLNFALGAIQRHRPSSRWDHDLDVRGADFTEQLVHRPSIVGPIGCEMSDRRVDLFEQTGGQWTDRPRCSS